MSDEKLDILSGEGTPIELITGKGSEAMMGLAERLEKLISSNDPRAKRLKEFMKDGYSPQEMVDSLNELLQKYQSIPDEGRTLLDVNNGATETEKLRIAELTDVSVPILRVTEFMSVIGASKFGEGILSKDDLKIVEALNKTSKEFTDLSMDLFDGKVDFKNFQKSYPSLTTGNETKKQMYDIQLSTQKNPETGEYFQLANQKFDTNKPEGNIFYKSDDGVIGFSTMASLQMHMLENHPELLKDKSIVEAYDRMNDKERFEFVKNLEVGGGDLLTRDEFQKELKENTNIIDGSIKNYNYDGLRLNSQEQADAALNIETETGGPSLSKGYLQAGTYISDDYNNNFKKKR